MKTLFVFIGLALVVAAALIDWRAAGLMWLAIAIENIMKWMDK